MSAVYTIGPFRLDTGVGALTCDGNVIPLGPRATAVLTALVEEAGTHVSKDRLMEAAWPGLVVEENNLAAQISAVRRALSSAPGGERWIETLPRRGYRFVGPVGLCRGAEEGRAIAGHLPRPLTSFVGRERELAEIAGLARERRLLTIVGVGGVGKTRLALELAAHSLERYRDGIWFVDLAPVSHEDAVPGALARALQVREEPGKAPMETVSAYLQGRELLLIFDNCEHVLQGCAQTIGELLQTAPGVRVVATSRESLHAEGEQLYTVPCLSLPESDAMVDVSRSDAVRLFLERARLRLPGFALDDANAAAIGRICRRLDGLPLALELAAARVEALSLDTLVERLDAQLRLPAATHRVSPRQQTLRATIEWSHELLSPEEKRLFARLAIFEGGWSLAAAEVVAGKAEPAISDVLEGLTRLVQKSLVLAEREGGRYRMLETIRRFAVEKLEDLPEREEVRAHHVSFHVEIAEQAERDMFGARQREARARLAADIDNVLAAHASCRRLDDGSQLALRLAAATRPFWLLHGLFRVGMDLTVDALERAKDAAASPPLAGALVAAAQLSHYMGRNQVASAYAMKGREVARAVANHRWQSLALETLANIARDEGHLASAHAHLEEALELARASDSELRVAGVLNALAELDRAEGRLESAVAAYEQALSISRKHDAGEHVAVMLVNIATCAVMRNEPQVARRRLVEALSIILDNGFIVLGWAALEVAAMIAAATGDWTRAARLHGAIDAQQEALSLQRSLHDERAALHYLEATRRALGDESFAAAHRIGRSTSYDVILVETAHWLDPGARAELESRRR